MGLPNIGPLELIIILAIALLVVGPGRLPEMGSAIGRTIREFRHASSDMADAVKVDSQPAAPSQPNTLNEAASPNVVAEPAAAPVAAGQAPATSPDVAPATPDEAPHAPTPDVAPPAAAEPAPEAPKADQA